MNIRRNTGIGFALAVFALVASSPAAAGWRGGGHNGFGHGTYVGSHRGHDAGHDGYHGGGWRPGDRDVVARGGRYGRGQARQHMTSGYDWTY